MPLDRNHPAAISFDTLLNDGPPECRLFLADFMRKRLVFDRAPHGGCLIVVRFRREQQRLMKKVGPGFRIMTQAKLVKQFRAQGGVPPEPLIVAYGPEVIGRYPAKITKDLGRLTRYHDKKVICIASFPPPADRLFDMARALGVPAFPRGREYLRRFCIEQDFGGGRTYQFDPAKSLEAALAFYPYVDTRFKGAFSEAEKP